MKLGKGVQSSVVLMDMCILNLNSAGNCQMAVIAVSCFLCLLMKS